MKLIFFANTDWYLFNFRLPLARHLRALGAEVVMVSPPGPYGGQLQAEGFRWIMVPLTRRSLNPLREAWLMWQLIRLYRDEQPDIAHHFTIKCLVYGGLAARLVGVRASVGAVTGMGFVFASQATLARILRPLVRMLMRVALGGDRSRLILQNADDRNLLVSRAVADPQIIRLIPGSGVDTTRFAPGERTRKPGAPKKVLFAARLLWEKGPEEYVAAARQLRQEGLDVEFLLAGDADIGNPNSVQPEQVDKWRGEGCITFLGHVDGMDELMRKVDVVTLPSFYSEGVPRSLTEAAAAGLPIVTTDTPGCRDVVEDGVNGYLIPVRDSKALAAALRKILTDDALASRMGAAGRVRALEKFDERLVFDRTVEVYRELIPDSGLLPAPA